MSRIAAVQQLVILVLHTAMVVAASSTGTGGIMDNSLTLKFLRVTPAHPHSITFNAALDTALALGSPHEREKDINAGFPDAIIVRLERLQTQNNFVFGELIRKQMSNIPPEANDEGLSPIQLSDGGGLGLSSAFRYHLPTRVLLIQANNQAVSAGRLNLYLKAVDRNAEYTFDPVAREDAWERFNSGAPRRLIMKIAAPNHITQLAHNALANEAETIGTGLASIGEALRGAVITIDVAMGQNKGSLLKGATERVVRTFRRLGNARQLDVRMLSASIKEGDSTDLIDFLDEHLVVRDRLDLPDRQPDRNYDVRAAFLETQFNEHLGYLHKLFG